MIHLRTIIFTIGVIGGTIIGDRSVYGSEVVVASLLLFVTQFVVLMVAKKTSSQEGWSLVRRSEVVFLTMILSLGIMLGVVRVQFVEQKQILVCEKMCVIRGHIVTLPTAQDEYQVFDLAVGDDEHAMNIRVRTPLYPEYEIGDTLTLIGKVTKPTIFYPHVGKKSFDYVSYLTIHNVGSEMYYPKIIHVEKSVDPSLHEVLQKYNHTLVTTVAHYVSSPASALAAGMLLGSDTMTKELTETFRVAGLSHIVVLSGFNIAIVIGVLLFLLRLFPIYVRVIGAAVFVILFVGMVGATPSIVRAVLMAFIALIALLLGKGYVPHQALILSLLSIVLYSPETITYDVSLHLSFLATAGIIYLRGNIQKGVHRISEKFQKSAVGEIITTTISAYMMTLPYMMYIFGTVSLYAVIVNVLVLPFVPIVMLLTFMIIVVSSFSVSLGYLFGYIVTIVCNCIIAIANFFEGLPYAKISYDLSLVGMVMMYVVLFFIYLFLRTRTNNETYETKEGEIISPVISF